MEVAELTTGQIQEYDNCQASLPSLVCAFDQDPPRTRPMAQTAVIYLFIIHFLFIYLLTHLLYKFFHSPICLVISVNSQNNQKQSIKIPLGLENKFIIIIIIIIMMMMMVY